jgi:outer membrane lipoprotein SlyB
MFRSTLVAAAMLVSVTVSGCALPSRGDVYAREETRQAWDVRYGTVTDVDPVTIEGHGTSGRVGGAVGSVAGAVVGSAVEEGVTRQKGLQITVELDGGGSIAVVQAADQAFAVGEKVKVFSRRDGAARVAKR